MGAPGVAARLVAVNILTGSISARMSVWTGRGRLIGCRRLRLRERSVGGTGFGPSHTFRVLPSDPGDGTDPVSLFLMISGAGRGAGLRGPYRHCHTESVRRPSISSGDDVGRGVRRRGGAGHSERSPRICSRDSLIASSSSRMRPHRRSSCSTTPCGVPSPTSTACPLFFHRCMHRSIRLPPMTSGPMPYALKIAEGRSPAGIFAAPPFETMPRR